MDSDTTHTSTPRFIKKHWPHVKYLILHTRKMPLFLVVVAFPWLAVFSYYYLLAADQFISETSFSVEEPGAGRSALSSTTLAAVTGLTGNNTDERVIESHILSMDMLELLDKELQLKSHYSAHPNADFWSRLAKDASKEDFLKFFKDHIHSKYDDSNGLLTIEVKTYDPDFSRLLLEKILFFSEKLVNEKSKEMAYEQLNFVQTEIKESEQNLIKARQALIAFQNEHALLNPEQQGQSLSSIISGLESNLATARAEYRQLLAYQRADSPQVVALQSKIKSLEAQIAQENTRLVSQSGQQSINQLYGKYKELELEVQVAHETYASALTALEQSRMDASRQLKYLMVINAPFTPEEALYPRKLYNLTTLAVVLLMLFGVTSMLITTIKEHHD